MVPLAALVAILLWRRARTRRADMDVSLRNRLDRIRCGNADEAQRLVTAYGIRTVTDLVQRVHRGRTPTPRQFDACADGFHAARDLQTIPDPTVLLCSSRS